MISNYIGSTVRFDTKAPGVLGASRANVTVLAVLDLDTAMILSDVRAKHAQVKNFITDLPASAGAYNYVKLRYGNGEVEVLGVPWVQADSIEVIEGRELFIRVRNATESVEATIRQALLQNGIEDFTIESQVTTAPRS